MGIRRCICPCKVGTKNTYGGSNLQLGMYELHKRGQQLFFLFYGTKFTLVLLSKIISKIRYSKACIIYTTMRHCFIKPLRFILTFKSNRHMISFERKHCKYDMHYILTCILSMHCTQVFHWWQRLLHKVFVRTIDSLYVSINHYPQHVFCFYIISYLCEMHLFSVWRSKIIFFRKNCVDFNFISLFHSYVYIHIALFYHE